jgi:hypothetical protein
MSDRNTFNLRQNPALQSETGITSKNFLPNVFIWMFVALGISAASTYLFSTNDTLLRYLVDFETGSITGLGTAARFAPLAFVLVLSFGMNRLSFPIVVLLYVLFAAIMGISISFNLMIYSTSSVLGCFISASGLFAVMAIAGYTTSYDLTRFGSILIMFLIGMVIASIVNWFLQSSQLDYIISFIGIAVFIGLTAYDVQRLKRIGAGIEYGDASANKMVIMGALSLYLDFINLFLMLLRVFGSRK